MMGRAEKDTTPTPPLNMDSRQYILLKQRRDLLQVELDQIEQKLVMFEKFAEHCQLHEGDKLLPTRDFIRHLLDNMHGMLRWVVDWGVYDYVLVNSFNDEGVTISTPDRGGGIRIPLQLAIEMRAEWLLKRD